MMFLHPLPPWALMWLLALSLYSAAKYATLVAGRIRDVPVGRKVAYLLFYPGMNAAEFCTLPPRVPCSLFPILRYAANVLIGTVLLWCLARLIPPAHPLLQGWVGMIGIILLLHFGILQLVSFAWRAAGFTAPPLMNQPIRSASVTEFWSLRWNTAFRQLSHQFLFKPLAHRFGTRAALLFTFAISGLVHDLLISLPAGAGFGLPTAYFLLQAAGVMAERTGIGRKWLRHRLAARCFAIAIVALPAPLLFHPPFVRRVILPFLVILHALPGEVLW